MPPQGTGACRAVYHDILNFSARVLATGSGGLPRKIADASQSEMLNCQSGRAHKFHSGRGEMTRTQRHTVSLLLAICSIADAGDHAASPTDDALRTKIAASFRVNYVLRDTRDATLVQTMIQVDDPPTDMAFDMSLRSGNETWPLGPVAWAAGEIHWWAYDTDLPKGIDIVDVVLTPSAQAALKVQHVPRHYPPKLKTIWNGSPIVLKGIKVRSQRISMCKIPPLAEQAAIEEALEHFDSEDPVVGQLKLDNDLAQAIASYRRTVDSAPDDALAQYRLGCLELANGDLMLAATSFAEAQRLDATPLQQRKIQRQLRRICAMYLYGAERGDVDAMCALGQAYKKGWGVYTDYQQAKRWLRNAANARNATAMRHLAAMYEKRRGATIQSEQAQQWYRSQTREWYQRAANLGDEGGETVDHCSRFSMIGSIAAILVCYSDAYGPAAPPSPEAQQPATEYRDWVDRYARPESRRSLDRWKAQSTQARDHHPDRR